MNDKDDKINPAWIFFIIVFIIAIVWFINGLMDLDDKVGKPIKVSENITIIRTLQWN